MGLKLFLDNNAIISLLKNEDDLLGLVSKSSSVHISVISELEFLSFSGLTTNDINLFRKFIKRISVIDLKQSDLKLINKITEVRKNYHLKLPDAIIVASAIITNSTLISRDKELSKVKEVKLSDWK
ncbi:PilT protein domain protein [Pseudopedobacter saltans DSM 12145]|uniref:PilT protein domain protein n=1 Tax=Pseudopedobacter saltans (strain ATCC 51119 / DSM 12145 / JCM 21818 / CCUG 39354 / LMG 10337 / NBRC 100064 / NCIMB 13643) TaxID=762903 RepID=F0SD75_PSESL|nr:PIN domain-containing protein [Pseudopedobacter saltans]ADY52861.1 PilT protein domain protein [Pseudopedobacter saltans DSM 12145]